MFWLDERDVRTSLLYPGRLKSLCWNTRLLEQETHGGWASGKGPFPLKAGVVLQKTLEDRGKLTPDRRYLHSNIKSNGNVFSQKTNKKTKLNSFKDKYVRWDACEERLSSVTASRFRFISEPDIFGDSCLNFSWSRVNISYPNLQFDPLIVLVHSLHFEVDAHGADEGWSEGIVCIAEEERCFAHAAVADD